MRSWRADTSILLSCVVQGTGEPGENHQRWMGDHCLALCRNREAYQGLGGVKQAIYPCTPQASKRKCCEITSKPYGPNQNSCSSGTRHEQIDLKYYENANIKFCRKTTKKNKNKKKTDNRNTELKFKIKINSKTKIKINPNHV